MATTVRQLAEWLDSLAEDNYPEDGLIEGEPKMQVLGALFCWWANAGARQAALDRGANLIVAHEAAYHAGRQVDPGCVHPDAWEVNKRIKQYYDHNGIALIRAHRTLDAYCITRVFSEHLGLPEPIVAQGYRGYDFTLVYEIEPRPFGELVAEFKGRMGLNTVRASVCDPAKIVRRLGLGWGGVGMDANLPYMERVYHHGAEVIIGGEVSELAIEFYRDCGMEWIELGHYASEVLGMKAAAADMAAAFPGLPVTCFEDEERIAFL